MTLSSARKTAQESGITWRQVEGSTKSRESHGTKFAPSSAPSSVGSSPGLW
jgi:hypothetical protein